MDEAPIPLLIALSVLLALAVGCIIYLITRIQALKQRVSEADIRQMVDMGEETGEIEKEERELIENVFEFNNSTAAEVMIHRTDVVMLWAEDPDEEIMKTIRDSGLTRFPVYEEDTDDIIGILNTRDYLLNAREERPKPLRKLLRKAYFVPETVRTDVLFRDMQSRKTHFAVVVDEYGGTSGIVTMEDLLESIVGDIQDEYDNEAQEITAISQDRYTLDGDVDLTEVSRLLGCSFEERSDWEDYDTLGGLLIAMLDRIPSPGEHPAVELDGVRFAVQKSNSRQILEVLAERLPQEE